MTIPCRYIRLYTRDPEKHFGRLKLPRIPGRDPQMRVLKSSEAPKGRGEKCRREYPRRNVLLREKCMKLGEKQVLTVVKTVDFGVYLGSDEERVLLPKKQVPEGIEIGDSGGSVLI